MMTKKLLIFLILSSLVLSGCKITIKTKSGYDGGVWRSPDFGNNWEQITLVYRVGDLQKTFSAENLTAMIMDPTDNQALYIGTEANGMFYTFDGAAGWHQTLTGLGSINAIAVNPKEHCIIYTAIENRIYKSTDCNRHWNYQLIETRAEPKDQVTSLAVDYFNPAIVYAGTSAGGLFVSRDSGYSWQNMTFFKDRLVKLILNSADSGIIYAATASTGIFKSSNGGQNWTQLITKEIEDKGNTLIYRELIADPTVTDGLLYASQYGLLRSADGGRNWQEIKLLTPPSTSAIYSIAINPRNGQEIYYGVASALYRSVDSGQNWITRNLPSSRAARFLIVDPGTSGVVYLGVKKIK